MNWEVSVRRRSTVVCLCAVSFLLSCFLSIDRSHRLDFRRSLESGLRSCSGGGARAHFPEQRLVIEPTEVIDSSFIFDYFFFITPLDGLSINVNSSSFLQLK